MDIKIVKEPIFKNELAEIAKNQFGDLVKAVVDVDVRKMTIQHENLAAGGWSKLSLAEQLGNVGSEVNRALRWQNKDDKSFKNAIARVLELLDLTIADRRWKSRLKELARTRELVCDALFGGKEFGTSLEDLNRYFFHFAVAARAGR
jgi:hypothetical protein